MNAHLCFKVGGFDRAGHLRSAEAYDPLTDRWRDVEPLNNPRCNFGIEVRYGHLMRILLKREFSLVAYTEHVSYE